MKENLKLLLVISLVILAIYLGFRIDYAIYKASHPGAPAWTYFFHHGR